MTTRDVFEMTVEVLAATLLTVSIVSVLIVVALVWS